MAGGVSSFKQGGKFDRPSACHYRYHLRHCALPKTPQNDSFHHRNKLEFNHTYLRNINSLQQDIFRLVYSNLDLSKAERILVKIISNVPRVFDETQIQIDPDGFLCEKIRSKNSFTSSGCGSSFEDSTSQNVVNLSLSSSFDMADSGLETGSVSPQESTVSENSGVDFEEPLEDSNKLSTARSSGQQLCTENGIQEDGRVELNKLKGLLESTSDYNSSDVYADATCSSSETEQQNLDSSSSYEENVRRARAREREEEISRYENQVLNDPFYESDSSSESEHATPFVQTTQSFEYVSAPAKAERSPEKVSSTASLEKTSKPASSYFFIDASTLNDDEIVANTSNKQVFVPANNDLAKNSTVELQPNLKLTDHLELPAESHKIKRIYTDDKITTEKESLAVEIKETDSGENTQQPSPCPENMLVEMENNDSAIANTTISSSDSIERIQPLVRGNTFELDSSEQQKISLIRQEHERRQGHLVFQNSIPQYSGHRVDDEIFVPLDKYNYDTVEKESESEKMISFAKQPLARCASQEHINDYDKDSEACSMSLPVTLNHDLKNSNPSKFDKKWEVVPIVSGGASSEDFIQPKGSMSPLVRRKTETTPIVSGGSVIMVEDVQKKKVKSSQMSSSMAAWVVDMSDFNKTQQNHTTMSHSFSSSDCQRKTAYAQKKPKSQGFFVSLNSMDSQNEKPKESATSKKEPAKLKDQLDKVKSCEFFIDISDDGEKKRPKRLDKTTTSEDKKNMFSMFIDLSDVNTTKSTDKSVRSEESSATEESERDISQRKSSGVFMYIESDSPVVRRRTLSSSRPPFKRHSWNTDKTNNVPPPTTSNGPPSVGKEILYRKEHKRAHSLSVDRAELRKFQGKASNSSHSLNEAIRPESERMITSKEIGPTMDTSSEDVFEFENRDTPPNSHVEILGEELLASAQQQHRDYRELQADSQYSDKTANTASTEEGPHRKSETFDISSGSSNNEFEVAEMMLNGGTAAYESKPVEEKPLAVSGRILETRKSLDEKIKEIECELEKEPEKQSSSFVRLSDLNKTPSQTSSIIEDKPPTRMSNSIPEISWIESSLGVGRSNLPVRSVPRNLSTNMSISLPPKQKSPLEDLVADGESENIVSESDLSSLQSSMGRSGAEGSTEETETSSFAGMKPYNRLGEDLLRMFLEEINPDVTIDVAGRRIRAHKCILSSRCQYFAAILSGGWIESEGNVISLQGYSYNAVHFALCHIYSGESNIPETISIVELATLADMLCLEGLKEVIGYTLKVKYCHLFHKPCQICAVGVLDCMPLAAAYGLDEVYRKSLRWVTRHFVRIWPCKAFATLPQELMEKCYHQHIVHMSTENVLQTMMDCDKLIATLPNVRWAEPIFRLVSNLLDASMKFLSDNMSGVLASDSFQNLGRELTWNISRLEDNFLAAAERLPPEQACKSYSKLHKMINSSAQTDDAQLRPKWSSLFFDFLRKIQGRVEKCLVRDATRAARTNAWLKMDLELRRHIQELACLVILPHEMIKRPSRRTNFLKEPRIPPQNKSTVNRNSDLRKVKMVISEHNDRTQKQSSTNIINSNATKRPLVKPKTDPMERKNLHLNDDKSGSDSNTSRPKSWPNKIEVKSRYLEPRHKSVPKNSVTQQTQEKVLVQQQRRKIMISSSDSSRTSSPAMKRASERKALAKPKIPVQKTTKALSSDSLTESNASKINNIKKTPISVLSKSCGITRPESPSLKTKEVEIGLSADSLAEPKSPCRISPAKKIQQANKLEISMSEDSLAATEATATPRSTTSSKISPILNRATPPAQKKPLLVSGQQKSPISVTKRAQRSLENSTAASRSRAAAISSTYHPAPSLRRSLLDAAKTPDVGTIRQQQRTTATRQSAVKVKDKDKDSPTKRSPKSNGAARIGARTQLTNQKKKEEKPKQNGELPRHLTVGSRSGTFLKDEPTILKKADLKTAQIDG